MTNQQSLPDAKGKKEKHPLFAVWMAVMLLLLALGILLLVIGLRMGPNRVFLGGVEKM